MFKNMIPIEIPDLFSRDQLYRFANFLKLTLSNEKNQKHEKTNSEEALLRKFLTKESADLLSKLKIGGFDNHVVITKPKLTPELHTIIRTKNTEFMQYLLFKCDSKETLQFWVSKSVKLTSDALGLALNLKSKLPVFECLSDNNFFHDKLDPEDKEELLTKALQLEKNTFDYIAKILNVDISNNSVYNSVFNNQLSK